MTRTFAIVAALSASITAVLVGCNLGAVAPAGGFLGGGPQPTVDGAGSDVGSGSGSCATKSTKTPDGHHNAGLSCITGGCHLPGSTGAGAPAFLIAGTLYTDSTGTTPVVGGTVVVTEGGNTHTLITSGTAGGSGNFYFAQPTGGATTITGPGSASASLCPSLMKMTNALNASATLNDGNCNRGGCHGGGGQDGGQPPVHL